MTSVERTKLFKKLRYEQKRCIDCGAKHETGHLRCQLCLDTQAEDARNRRMGKMKVTNKGDR